MDWARGICLAVSLLLTACASVQRQPHQELMHAAAAECQDKYRSDVERYEFDHFGRIVAYYKENRSKQVLDPFFACYKERLREKIQAASPTPTEAAGSVGARADLGNIAVPVWKRGYEWSYLWESPRGSGTFVWIVSRVETLNGVECYVIRSGRRELFWRVSDLATMQQTNEGVIETRYTPPRQAFAWPLAPGKTWEQQWTLERPQDRETLTRAQMWAVEGEEKVVVPAGDFSALKVVVRNKATNSIALEYWYSPAARQIVRSRDHLSYGVETRVLTAFKLD